MFVDIKTNAQIIIIHKTQSFVNRETYKRSFFKIKLKVACASKEQKQNMKQFRLVSIALCAIIVCSTCYAADSDVSAADVMTDIYTSCLSQYSTACVKPKALAWISSAVKSRQIKITEDLSIIKTDNEDTIDFSQQRSGDPRVELFDKIDSFLASHSIRINAPQILKTQEARSFVADYPDLNLEQSLELPLTDGNVAEGMPYIKAKL